MQNSNANATTNQLHNNNITKGVEGAVYMCVCVYMCVSLIH